MSTSAEKLASEMISILDIFYVNFAITTFKSRYGIRFGNSLKKFSINWSFFVNYLLFHIIANPSGVFNDTFYVLKYRVFWYLRQHIWSIYYCKYLSVSFCHTDLDKLVSMIGLRPFYLRSKHQCQADSELVNLSDQSDKFNFFFTKSSALTWRQVTRIWNIDLSLCSYI